MSGNIWMFSDQIDDVDLEFAKKAFITYRMGREYYGLGEKPMIRLAWESGAVYKIGKKVLIRRDIVAIVDDERVMVLENRRGNGQVGQVKVSVQKTKGCKQMQPMKRAANF